MKIAVGSGRQRGSQVANHDSSVAGVALAALALCCALPACAGSTPATDATAVVRLDGPDIDNEGEGENAVLAPPRTPRASGQLEWTASEVEGSAQSKSERRPMLVSFGTEWCGTCKRLAKETFGDPRVKKQAGRFVAVSIDATNDEDPQVSAALLKYAVIGVPTIILLDSSGNEQRRFTEFVQPDTLLAAIAPVR